jgi:hypothetical protein
MTLQQTRRIWNCSIADMLPLTPDITNGTRIADWWMQSHRSLLPSQKQDGRVIQSKLILVMKISTILCYILILKASFFVSVWWIWCRGSLWRYKPFHLGNHISAMLPNEVFWTGLKIDPVCHFSTLNIQIRCWIPLRIELRRGIYYFDHEPCSKFNSIKTSNIYTPMVYSIKNLNLIPVCNLLVQFWRKQK